MQMCPLVPDGHYHWYAVNKVNKSIAPVARRYKFPLLAVAATIPEGAFYEF